MNKTEIITFLIFVLKVPKELAILVVSKLDCEYLETLSREDAEEEIEDILVNELFKRIALKLYPFYRMGKLKSPDPTKKYQLIDLSFIWHNTQRIYESSSAYPLEKLLARYRGLCALGSKSLAYAESQKELLTTSDPIPNAPNMWKIQYELDPAQVSAYIVDVVNNLSEVIPPIM
jgi:hypothetical protein